MFGIGGLFGGGGMKGGFPTIGAPKVAPFTGGTGFMPWGQAPGINPMATPQMIPTAPVPPPPPPVTSVPKTPPAMPPVPVGATGVGRAGMPPQMSGGSISPMLPPGMSVVPGGFPQGAVPPPPPPPTNVPPIAPNNVTNPLKPGEASPGLSFHPKTTPGGQPSAPPALSPQPGSPPPPVTRGLLGGATGVGRAGLGASGGGSIKIPPPPPIDGAIPPGQARSDQWGPSGLNENSMNNARPATVPGIDHMGTNFRAAPSQAGAPMNIPPPPIPTRKPGNPFAVDGPPPPPTRNPMGSRVPVAPPAPQPKAQLPVPVDPRMVNPVSTPDVQPPITANLVDQVPGGVPVQAQPVMGGHTPIKGMFGDGTPPPAPNPYRVGAPMDPSAPLNSGVAGNQYEPTPTERARWRELGNSQDTLPGTFDDHSDARAASLYPTNDGSVHPTVAGLYPDFSNALLAMNAANPHGPVQLMGPRSGFRSMSEQKAIAASVRAKRGANWRKWAAKPGTSKHGWGVAGDLKYASPAQKKWIHENAGKYGLYFPMAHEPWHIQLKNIGDARNLAAAGLVSY